MTRREIKLAMIERINNALESLLEETDLLELVDQDMILNFLWERDFGHEIARNYLEENLEELVEEQLQEIYDEIDSSDLDCPF